MSTGSEDVWLQSTEQWQSSLGAGCSELWNSKLSATPEEGAYWVSGETCQGAKLFGTLSPVTTAKQWKKQTFLSLLTVSQTSVDRVAISLVAAGKIFPGVKSTVSRARQTRVILKLTEI